MNFVVGCPRSGTTLLSTLLGRHSKISVPAETHFADQLLPDEHQKLEVSHDYIWDSINHNAYLEDLELEAAQVEARFRLDKPSFRGLFFAYLDAFADREQKAMVVEKTPDHLYYFETLADWFPEAKFIVLVRDGRAVSNSLTKVPWASDDLLHNMRVWRSAAKKTLQIAHDKQRVRILRYEDLIQDPRKHLGSVMRFLGMDLEEAQFDSQIKVNNVAERERPWKSLASAAPDLSRRDAWRSEMTPADQDRCTSLAANQLWKLDYPVPGGSARQFVRAKIETARYRWQQSDSERQMRRKQAYNARHLKPEILDGTFINSLRSHALSLNDNIKRSVTNCALIAHEDGYLGIFKSSNFDYRSHDIGIALPRRVGRVEQSLFEVELDRNLQALRVAKISVSVDGAELSKPDTLLEDPRLLKRDKAIMGTINYIPDGDQSQASVLFCEYFPKEKELHCFSLEGLEPQAPQKNWVPVDCKGELLVQLDIHPFTTARIDAHERRVLEVKTNDVRGVREPELHGLQRLSGGTPLIERNGQILGVGHGFLLENRRRMYYSFFYAVDIEEDHALRAISPYFKLPDMVPVQFVTGWVLDADTDDFVLSYGVADCDNYFFRFSGNTLDALLKHENAQVFPAHSGGIRDSGARRRA
ncbi:MAG: sulfotransferase [Congregibacter sp.]